MHASYKGNDRSAQTWRSTILWPLFGFLTMFLLGTSFLQASDCSKVVNENTGETFTNLQLAIDNANPEDTLLISGKFRGNFVIGKSLFLVGKHDAVLDGKNTGTVLFVFTPEGSVDIVTVRIKNLTIEHGNASEVGGGGILNINANLILKESTVKHNQSLLANGAGILNLTIREIISPELPPIDLNFTAILTLIDSTVEKNTTTQNGGGIANIAGALFIEDSTIIANIGNLTGGGIFSLFGSNTIVDSKVASNVAGQGGGIESLVSTTILEHVHVKNNTAAFGGGVYSGHGPFSGPSTLTINDSKFHGNNTSVALALGVTNTLGGGIFNDDGSTATLNNSKVIANIAVNAGGIFNNVGGTLHLNETKVVDNIPNNIVNLD